LILIVLSSAIGLAVMLDSASDKSQSISVGDFFSQTKTKTIKLSDGVGIGSKG